MVELLAEEPMSEGTCPRRFDNNFWQSREEVFKNTLTCCWNEGWSDEAICEVAKS